MSRDSQNAYRHEVKPTAGNNLRYSLTFRCVHWTHLNSTYAVGDSNFGKIKFGEGKSYIGKATPGKLDFAAKIENIEPSKCQSFSNVVIMCGTNNLKEPNVDVLASYKVYKGKLEEIRRLNSRANIIVCPILPSRSSTINQNILNFNQLLFKDLTQSSINVNIVQGFGAFVDSGGLLRNSLHDKRTINDVLHINGSGYGILVKCIKTAIFNAKRTRNRFTTSRLFSNVVRGGPLNPV